MTDALFCKIKQAAFEQGKRLVSNPTVMKIMANPHVMNLLMRAVTAPGRFKQQVGEVGRSLGFASQTEVESLKRTVDSLEDTMSSLEQRINGEGKL